MTLYGTLLVLLLGVPFVRGLVDLWRRRWAWGVLMIAYAVLLLCSVDGRGI